MSKSKSKAKAKAKSDKDRRRCVVSMKDKRYDAVMKLARANKLPLAEVVGQAVDAMVAGKLKVVVPKVEVKAASKPKAKAKKPAAKATKKSPKPSPNRFDAAAEV